MQLKKSVLTRSQLKGMLAGGLLSAKGKKQAKSALMGKYDITRYRR